MRTVYILPIVFALAATPAVASPIEPGAIEVVDATRSGQVGSPSASLDSIRRRREAGCAANMNGR
jgi:hypothetical protein